MSYEYYDLLRTDMIRCKTLKISISTTLFTAIPANAQCLGVGQRSDDQTGELLSLCTDALYLTDNWIAVAGIRYQYSRSMRVKAVLLMSILTAAMNMDAQTGVSLQTDAIGILICYYSQTFMPQSSIASYIGDLPRNHLMLTKSGQNSSCSMV